MKLPNAERAVVPERKIVAYLLNATHPAGGSKAHFFLSFGFNVAHWRELADALAQHAHANEVAETEQTPHGVRYVVDGPLKAPGGTVLNIRCAWYIDSGSETPRFVTAHPLPKL